MGGGGRLSVCHVSVSFFFRSRQEADSNSGSDCPSSILFSHQVFFIYSYYLSISVILVMHALAVLALPNEGDTKWL